ncbi:MAG: ectoine hydroxylase [Nitrospirae bacterium]|jgi:ectoine hydroxylase|nr:ectoine hydroxylase [Nitrospirota bacterium]
MNIRENPVDLYPSRRLNEPAWYDRRDPVVHADDRENAPIGPERVREFDQNGYLVLPGLFSSEEVAVFRHELDRIREDARTGDSGETIRERESGAVRSVFAVHRNNALFSRVAGDERIAGIARFLLGGDVYIHQSRLNFKPGFIGEPFPWHSDFETWHVEDGMPRMRALSCSILLTDNTPFNGPLMLIPGSHRHFIHCVGKTPDNHYRMSLQKQEYGVPDPESLGELVFRYGIDMATGSAGSVVFFDCNILHGSGGNISPFPRSNLFYVYNHIDNTIQDDLREKSPRPSFVAEREVFAPLDIQQEHYV